MRQIAKRPFNAILCRVAGNQHTADLDEQELEWPEWPMIRPIAQTAVQPLRTVIEKPTLCQLVRFAEPRLGAYYWPYPYVLILDVCRQLVGDSE